MGSKLKKRYELKELVRLRSLWKEARSRSRLLICSRRPRRRSRMLFKSLPANACRTPCESYRDPLPARSGGGLRPRSTHKPKGNSRTTGKCSRCRSPRRKSVQSVQKKKSRSLNQIARDPHPFRTIRTRSAVPSRVRATPRILTIGRAEAHVPGFTSGLAASGIPSTFCVSSTPTQQPRPNTLCP